MFDCLQNTTLAVSTSQISQPSASRTSLLNQYTQSKVYACCITLYNDATCMHESLYIKLKQKQLQKHISFLQNYVCHNKSKSIQVDVNFVVKIKMNFNIFAMFSFLKQDLKTSKMLKYVNKILH